MVDMDEKFPTVDALDRFTFEVNAMSLLRGGVCQEDIDKARTAVRQWGEALWIYGQPIRRGIV